MTWLGTRAYWTLAIFAALLAAGAAWPVCEVLALALIAALVAAFTVDALVAPAIRRIEIERNAPGPFALRRAGAIAYHMRNRAPVPLIVTIVEAPNSLLEYDRDELRAPLAAFASARIERPVTPIRRGASELETIFVRVESVLGLLSHRLRVPARSPLRVYPDLQAVERYGRLRYRRSLLDAGLRRMRLPGQGTHPESVREWCPGDAFRSIAWKATARRGGLMVAQHEVERSQTIMILLDVGRLTAPLVGKQRKIDYAVTAALSVAAIAALVDDKVGLVAFAGAIVRAFPPSRNARSLKNLAAHFYDLESRFEESDFERAFVYTRTHMRKRGLVVLFSDLIDPVAQSGILAQVAGLAKQHCVVCVLLNDAAIENALAERSGDVQAAYRVAVALELREQRRSAIAALGRFGVRVVDVSAPQMTTALIDRYLELKGRGEI